MRLLQQITNIRRLIRVALLGFAVVWNLSNANGFTFTPGHLYGTGNTRDIIEYSETGAVLGSLTVPSLIPGDELLGIVFGRDRFLYAVKANPFNVPGFSVLVLDSSGTVHNNYTYTNAFFNYDSYGKIALDQQYIYVAGDTSLFRFTLGDPNSGVPIYYNLGFGVFDVKTLPNGHLFVAYAYGVDEITNTGAIVRSIPLIGGMGQFWVDVRGIEYDPAINKLFATELGQSPFFLFPLMRIDASTGVLENHVSFVYGDDLFLTRSNTLLVGSQSQAPAIYDENLTFIAPLGAVQRAFVTQCPTTGPTPTPTPTPNPRAVVADFNGDGHPDLVVRNVATNQTVLGYMNNNVVIGAAIGPTLTCGWTLRSAADFNGDSHPDYALFLPATLQTEIWYLSGPVRIGSASGPSLPVGWELVTTADINGDGHPDYVLYKASTRQTAVGYLNNNVLIGAAFGPTLPAGWNVIGAADFNGDGHPDWVLFKSSTGQTAIAYLSGPTVIGAALGPTIPMGWQLVAVADFNGDGHPDYLLYNASTRQTTIWYLNNNLFVSAAAGPTLPAGWSLIGP